MVYYGYRFHEKVSHSGVFSPWHMRAMNYVTQLECSKTIEQPYLANPSILQTTLAARASKLSSQTVPHMLLWNTSSRPSNAEAPLTRRIRACAEKMFDEWVCHFLWIVRLLETVHRKLIIVKNAASNDLTWLYSWAVPPEQLLLPYTEYCWRWTFNHSSLLAPIGSRLCSFKECSTYMP